MSVSASTVGGHSTLSQILNSGAVARSSNDGDSDDAKQVWASVAKAVAKDAESTNKPAPTTQPTVSRATQAAISFLNAHKG